MFKPVRNVPSKPVKSQDVCKPVSNVPINFGNSGIVDFLAMSLVSMKNLRLLMIYFKHSKFVVSKSVSHNSDSANPVPTVEPLNDTSNNTENLVAPELVNNVSSKSGQAQAVCKFVINLIG